MNKQELLAIHPELHAELIAEGEAKERDRVVAHLTLAERSGEMPTALASIRSGDGLTAEIMERHLDARLCRLETRERQFDSDEAGKVLEGAAPTAEGKDLGDQVADIIEAQMGKKVVSA